MVVCLAVVAGGQLAVDGVVAHHRRVGLGQAGGCKYT